MEKDAYYFPHFCNARNDRKIRRLRKELGLEGYGIFFMVLEILREQIDYQYPLADIDLLSDEIDTSEQKVKTVIHNYGLFDIVETERGQYFFSPKLIIYMQPYLNMKKQRQLAGMKSAQKRKELSTTVERPLNDRLTTDEQSKVNESKSKELNKESVHDQLVKLYGEKVVKDYCERIQDYSASTGKKYKDIYATARNWIKRDKEQGKGPTLLPPPPQDCPACGSRVTVSGCNTCTLEKNQWGKVDYEPFREYARKRGHEC